MNDEGKIAVILCIEFWLISLSWWFLIFILPISFVLWEMFKFKKKNIIRAVELVKPEIKTINTLTKEVVDRSKIVGEKVAEALESIKYVLID